MQLPSTLLREKLRQQKKWHDGEYGLPYSSVKKTMYDRIEKHISESLLHKN